MIFCMGLLTTNYSVEWSVNCTSDDERVKGKGVVVVCCLLNVPATCECISGKDLHRQLYVLPH